MVKINDNSTMGMILTPVAEMANVKLEIWAKNRSKFSDVRCGPKKEQLDVRFV